VCSSSTNFSIFQAGDLTRFHANRSSVWPVGSGSLLMICHGEHLAISFVQTMAQSSPGVQHEILYRHGS
jgi:hypothetical protein